MTEKSNEEQLLEFLYACPVGLIECDLAGEIAVMNPHAMQHLLPLAGPRDVSNLFAALERHAPELRNLVAAYKPSLGSGLVDHSQKMTVAARAIAEKKAVGQRS